MTGILAKEEELREKPLAPQRILLTEEPIASLIKACLETKIGYVESQLQDHVYRGLLWRCIESVRAPKVEAVNHPPHYGGEADPYETVKVIEAWGLGWHLGDALKYISRAGKKNASKEIEDLKKAVWYVQRRIYLLEKK